METIPEQRATTRAWLDERLLAPDELASALHGVQSERYYDKHPFHHLMFEGRLPFAAIQSWVANHLYYQEMIPIKDAAILSNCPYPAVRRVWMQRLVYHDGAAEGQGGTEDWLRLVEAVGLSRQEVLYKYIPRGVRFALDAYVTFARTQTWIEAVAASLPQRWFAPDLTEKLIVAFERYYDWVHPAGLTYLRRQLTQAPHDATSALELVIQYCHTREQQERAIAAWKFKCDVLWSFLDAIHQTSPRILDRFGQ